MLPFPKPTRRDSALILVAAITYGLLVAAILPGWPIAMNDDFGYLRSIIETIQHGRPWTNDFLEPWSLSLVAVSAGIFKLTGSFSLATIGLQTAMGAVSFWLVCRIAHDGGYRTLASIGLAICLLTFPTVLWKQIEYTALVVYLSCLFAALWFAGRNRWTWFFLAWAIAVASRPSALVWLAIPVFAGLEAAIRGKDWAKLKSPALLALPGAGWFYLVRSCANETHAQRFITSNIFSNATLPIVWRNFQTGLWIMAVAAGCALLLFRALRRQPDSPRTEVASRLAAVVVATGLLATLPLVAHAVPLSFEHTLFENNWAEAYLKGLVVIGAIGWLLANPSFRAPYLGAAFAALALASFRSELWDYYLIDATLLAFFAVGPGANVAGGNAATPNRMHWMQPALAGGLMLGIIALHIAATGPLKRLVDHRAGACTVLEKALRAGWMKPTELSDAPFGFVAWHLLPYYLTHEGKNSADLGGFGIYVKKDAVNVCIQGVSRREAAAAKWGKPAQDPAHPFSEIHPRGWFGYARFTLDRLDNSQPAAVAIKWEEYHYPLFPLNDAEWRELSQSSAGK